MSNGIRATTILMLLSLPAFAETDALEERTKSTHARDVFREALPFLDDAAALFDRHEKLPRSKWFGADRASNTDAINSLLDDAIAVLGVSETGDVRARIRALEEAIAAATGQISGYREKRISAPAASEPVGKLDQYNPFRMTKEDYDKKIDEAREQIDSDTETLAELRRDFADSLRGMGIDVSDEAAESLLATISGDDFISMCIVFDNLKIITVLLQGLTDETGEDPETARRYYGMYVIIAKILDRLQAQYVATIKDAHIPDLQRLADRARQNITEAKKLIRSRSGDRAALESNIAANDVTIDASEYYIQYLKEISELIEQQHAETVKILATAVNTYKTVDVSVNVGDLIARGSASLDRLMKLKMPQLRAFDNEVLRREYQRLSAHMGDAP